MRSSRFGWSLVDRCDVELFTLRGIDRNYSAANSVWSFTSGFDGGSWCIEGRDRSVHVSLCVCDGCVSSAGASVLVQLLAWVECEYERCGFGVVRTVDSVISIHPNRVDGEICVLLCGSVESNEEWWSVERWKEHLWSCRSIEGVGKSELFVGKNDVITSNTIRMKRKVEHNHHRFSVSYIIVPFYNTAFAFLLFSYFSFIIHSSSWELCYWLNCDTVNPLWYSPIGIRYINRITTI